MVGRHQNDTMAVSVCRRMSFDDFATNFSKVEMCLTLPNFDALSTSNNNIRKKIQWQMTPHEGSWKKGVNAGGCINHLSMPQ